MKRIIAAAIAAGALLFAGSANAVTVVNTFNVVEGSTFTVTDNCSTYGYPTPTCTNIGGAYLEAEETWDLLIRGSKYPRHDYASLRIFARNSGSGVDETFYLGFIRDGVVVKQYFTIPATKRHWDFYGVEINANAPLSVVRFIMGSDSPGGPVVGYMHSYVQAVPEPATWAMMIIGFGLAGAAIRRRRSSLGFRLSSQRA